MEKTAANTSGSGVVGGVGRDKVKPMTAFGKRQFTSVNNVSNFPLANAAAAARFPSSHATISASALLELRQSIK